MKVYTLEIIPLVVPARRLLLRRGRLGRVCSCRRRGRRIVALPMLILAKQIIVLRPIIQPGPLVLPWASQRDGPIARPGGAAAHALLHGADDAADRVRDVDPELGLAPLVRRAADGARAAARLRGVPADARGEGGVRDALDARLDDALGHGARGARDGGGEERPALAQRGDGVLLQLPEARRVRGGQRVVRWRGRGGRGAEPGVAPALGRREVRGARVVRAAEGGEVCFVGGFLVGYGRAARGRGGGGAAALRAAGAGACFAQALGLRCG